MHTSMKTFTDRYVTLSLRRWYFALSNEVTRVQGEIDRHRKRGAPDLEAVVYRNELAAERDQVAKRLSAGETSR
jgi:hypothetical protein